MAVLSIVAVEIAPVEAFFYKTPPRRRITCNTAREAVEKLQKRQCKYVLLPEAFIGMIPCDVEVRTCRVGFALLQRKGQVTRSDRRARHRAFIGAEGPKKPYFVP
ncbi:MAG: hypothetical protein HYT49_00810 [Candidatus Wildermuthbacteria bacterium]|nr:hypothetical protein [Candidatus Wildermuthbacteria bacterium]